MLAHSFSAEHSVINISPSSHGHVTERVCSHARQIVVGGKPLLRNVARHYFAVNKPKGYLCASSAAPDAVGARKLVIDLFAVRPSHLGCMLFVQGFFGVCAYFILQGLSSKKQSAGHLMHEHVKN